MTSRLMAYSPETESPADEFLETENLATAQDRDAAFDESDEMELAARALDVQSEADLDRFLGDLIERASGAAGGLRRSPAGDLLGGLLKGAARRALPAAGRALGRAKGGGGATPPGTLTGMAAGRVFGLELEGLSPEDAEFEVARRFVRLGHDAVQHVLAAPPATPASDAARRAMTAAVRRHAPGLTGGSGLAPPTASAGIAPFLSSAPARHTGNPPQQGVETMHDIDRTQLEYDTEFEEESAYGEGEWGDSETLTEADEMELASALLGVNNEEELEQFLGDLVRKASKAVGAAIRSPIGQAVGGVLKSAAKKALPLAGGALGGYFGGPLGAKIGSGLASAAGRAVGLEAEMMSPEDREFEGARQFVKFAADTVKNAAAQRGANPSDAAKSAAVTAARKYLPGLLAPQGGRSGGTAGAQSGRWVRRGTKIVLYGV